LRHGLERGLDFAPRPRPVDPVRHDIKCGFGQRGQLGQGGVDIPVRDRALGARQDGVGRVALARLDGASPDLALEEGRDAVHGALAGGLSQSHGQGSACCGRETVLQRLDAWHAAICGVAERIGNLREARDGDQRVGKGLSLCHRKPERIQGGLGFGPRHGGLCLGLLYLQLCFRARYLGMQAPDLIEEISRLNLEKHLFLFKNAAGIETLTHADHPARDLGCDRRERPHLDRSRCIKTNRPGRRRDFGRCHDKLTAAADRFWFGLVTQGRQIGG